MTTALTILVPTMPSRTKYLNRLMSCLTPQNGPVKIFINDQVGISIGEKRNQMMAQVKSPYLCFVDDDDLVSDNYVSLIMQGLETNPDCCSLNGIITTDGQNPKPFKHSIEYKTLYEENGIYYRPVNHINTVRTEIARQIGFPDWQYSEDSNYAIRMEASGLLKTEYKIEPVLYYYLYRTDKRNEGERDII